MERNNSEDTTAHSTPHAGEGAYAHARSGALTVSDEGYFSQSTDLSWSPDTPGFLEHPDSNIAGDIYIDLFYKHFHRLHPCALPRKHLEKLLEIDAHYHRLKLVLWVMRSIGSLYACPNQHHLEKAGSRISVGIDPLQDAFSAQCLLLNSIALYWCGDEDSSGEEMDRAVQIALSNSMHQRAFASTHEMQDPVLEESLRRTWWQIWIVDFYYAAMKKKPAALMSRSDITADLPCEESEYEKGVIPTPKTLESFTIREFSTEEHAFSSFAYLIGAVQAVSSAMRQILSDSTGSEQFVSYQVLAVATEGWRLLLPETKRWASTKDGEVDELMFQALMVVHAATVSLHRHFSGLLYDPSELFSSCPTACHGNILRVSTASGDVHTRWCIRAASAQIRLFAQSSVPSSHTPFTVCMLVNALIALISACRYELKGSSLKMARDEIRMGIGCLKSFAAVWRRAGTQVREVQTIAQELLLSNVSRESEALFTQASVMGNADNAMVNVGNSGPDGV